MRKHTPTLAISQAVTTSDRSFVIVVRFAIAIALLIALLAVSIALLHTTGIHSGGLVPAAAHHLLVGGPNTWCPGTGLPC